MDKSKNIFILGVVLFLSIIFSYIILEDTIGGAENDFNFHKKFIILFAEDFKNTFYNYGKGELLARNSPIFYIFLSFLYKIGICEALTGDKGLKTDVLFLCFASHSYKRYLKLSCPLK